MILSILKAIGSAIADFFLKIINSIINFFKDTFNKIKTFFKYFYDKEYRNEVNRKRKLHKSNKIQEPKGDKAFNIVNFIIMVLLIIIIVVPLLYLIASAFSDGAAQDKIIFLPKIVVDGQIQTGITWKYFEYIIFDYDDGIFINSFKNTMTITIVVTLASNILMALAGYAFSKEDFPFKKGLLIFFIITMLFSAGVVPSYLLMSSMKLTESIWGIIIISLSNVFNMLLYKTTFEGIPKDLEEAATIDGATSMQLFFKVIVPITLPTFASCCFFTLVGCINGYGSALLFIRENVDAKPMALIMYELITISEKNITDPFLTDNIFNIQSAAIILSVIPILLIYPFIIRYIKSGITLGSVK